MEASNKADNAFLSLNSHSHTTSDSGVDMHSMVTHLLACKVGCKVQGRSEFSFSDPTEQGLKKMCNTGWISEIMASMPEDTQDSNVLDDTEYNDLID